MFPCSYKNTSGCLGEREIEVWIPRNFEFSQTCMSFLYRMGTRGKNVLYFVYKITRTKLLKRGNRPSLSKRKFSILSSWWRMRWRIMAWTFLCFPYSYRNMAFNQSRPTFWKCYFIIPYIKRLVSKDFERTPWNVSSASLTNSPRSKLYTEGLGVWYFITMLYAILG